MNLRRVLRTLILVEISLVVLSIAQGVIGRGLLPVELQNYELAQDERDLSSSEWVLAALALPAFALLIVGWIGLWRRLRPWARAIYTAAWALAVIVATFTGPSIESWLGQLLGDLGVLAAGVILGLIYFSDLRHHFEKSRQASEVPAA